VPYGNQHKSYTVTPRDLTINRHDLPNQARRLVAQALKP
jgi:hypothetical protein